MRGQKKAATIPECGTKGSLFAQHDWSVWDEHYRHCRQCGKTEAVGVSKRATTPAPELIRGRGHIHQWKGHPFWSSTATIEVQYCRCGATRAITREPEKPVYLPPTLVVHCRKDEFTVYVGRRMTRYPELHAAGFGNPFTVKNLPRGYSSPIDAFRDWLLGKPALVELYREQRAVIWTQLPMLRGKVIGCWCAPKGGLVGNLHGTVCHGEVLAWLADHPKFVQEYRAKVGGDAA